MRETRIAILLIVYLLAFPCLKANADETATDEPLQLDKVTVTSQKTEADKQDISSNISVFDGTLLEELKIDKLQQTVYLAPNINYNQMDAHTVQYVFRGIGGTANMNKMYYVNIDGVTVPYVATGRLLDVERVEMLRGGQGAWYGQNTHSGLINIISRDPEFSELNSDVSVAYESHNTPKVNAVVDGMLTEDLAFRFAGGYIRSDGFYENTFYDKDDTNDNEHFTGRAKFTYIPDESDRVTLIVFGDAFNSGFDSYGPVGKNPTLKTENDQTGKNGANIITPTLTWDHTFDNDITLTTISNYSHSTYNFVHDWDFSQADISTGKFDETFNVVSQEIRLTGGERESFQWLTGIFGRYEHLTTESKMEFGLDAGMGPGLFEQQNSTQITKTLSAFGQVIYRIFPQIELTGALRLDYEHRDLDWKNTSTTGTPEVTYDDSESWVALSPAGSIAWIISQEHRIYASVSRGFKSGEYNMVMPVPLVVTAGPVDPEYTTTYELGYKGNYLKNRLEFNTALFYIDWTDMQTDLLIPGSGGMYQKINAAEAHSSGLEIDARMRAARGWDIFASGGLMFEYKFDKFKGDGTTEDLTGKYLPYTNKFTASLGTMYQMDNGLFIGGDMNYRGAYYLIENNSQKQNAYLLLNATVGYRSDNWEVSLYGRNLSNERYAVSSFNGALMAGEPLTFGALVKAYF